MQKIEKRSPGRVELLGNHTDYNEGWVLSFATEHGITVLTKPRNDSTISLSSGAENATVSVSLDNISPRNSKEELWANYPLGVVAQFLKKGVCGCGFEMVFKSDLPSGAGLSSSAALECATARALQSLWGTSFSGMELARMCQAAEHGGVGVPCGLQDQISSLFGVSGKILFLDFRTLEIEMFPAPKNTVFILAMSGVSHALVAGEYNERRESCHGAAKALGIPFLRDISGGELETKAGLLTAKQLARARHVVGENGRVLRAKEALLGGDVAGFGQLMFESHESSKSLFENSCPELDFLVDAARNIHGCFGARLSGGGFGGATINLVREDALPVFESALRAAFEARYGRRLTTLVTRASGSDELLQ